jgi:hypothetical protein
LTGFAKVAIAILFVPQSSDEKGPVAIDELLRKCHAYGSLKIVICIHTITAGLLLATRAVPGVAQRLHGR